MKTTLEFVCNEFVELSRSFIDYLIFLSYTQISFSGMIRKEGGTSSDSKVKSWKCRTQEWPSGKAVVF